MTDSTEQANKRIADNKNREQDSLNNQNMEQIKAKFQCSSAFPWDKDGGSEVVNMHAVYGGSTNAEDNTFSQATPSAQAQLWISNKEAQGFFKPGKKYYAVFTEAAE